MILKAIVEKIIDKYNIKVRIPELDRASYNAASTLDDDLNTAIICTLPGFDLNLEKGDIVFVTFEPSGQCLILGCLYRKLMPNIFSDCSLNSIDVISRASLPQDTSIGNVKSSDIKMLEGCSDNIQKQMNSLKESINNIMNNYQRSGNILIQSPSGNLFKLIVDDDGVLSSIKVDLENAQ